MREGGKQVVGESVPQQQITETMPLMGRLKPYPAYKESGVEWLGKLPTRWEVRPFKRICTLSYGDALASTERIEGHVDVYGSNGPVGTHDRANTKAPCLVVGRKGSFGKVNYSDKPVFAIDTTFLVDSRYTSAEIRWLYYLLQHAKLDGVSRDSAVPGLDREDVYRREVACCLLMEQHAIAAFLDRETAQIDALVAKKERLIGLLQEKRTALITRAVTKGLDPDVPMKDSGVEWLGVVPANWDLLALKRRWNVVDCKHLTVPFVGEGIPLASVRETQSFELDLKDAQRTTVEWYKTLIEGGRKPRRGDLIYCRNVSVGSASLVTGDDLFAMGQDVCLIRSSTENQRWLNYFLCSSAMSYQLASTLVGSTFNRINVAEVMTLLIPVPPRVEQDRIAQFLELETAKIDSLVAKVYEAIDHLRELRTALISAAVTGKIDVRDGAAQTPGIAS